MNIENGPVETVHPPAEPRSRVDRSATAQVGRHAAQVARDLRDIGDIAKDATRDSIEQLRDNAAAYVENGKDQMHQAEHTIEQYIRERPIKSILIATGVGMLLGRLWMRR